MSSGASVPERCTVCDTPLVAGESRCRACGKVYGDDNLCPHCHATAGVIPRAGGYVCAACSRPRDRKPGTVVLGGPSAGGGRPGAEAAQRGASVGLRTAGALSIGVGVMAAALAAMIIPGGLGIALAVLAGAGGVGVGALALRAGSKAADAAGRSERLRQERRVLELAQKSDGDLTVTEVARSMHLTMEEADHLLSSMADGSRVTMEIDPEGLIHYVFRELRHVTPPAHRVRVAPGEGEAAEPAEVEVPSEEAEPRARER